MMLAFYISIPILYIYGWACLISKLRRGSTNKANADLLEWLKKKLKSNPNLSLKEALAKYEDSEEVQTLAQTNSQKQTGKTSASVWQQDLGSVWSNWYSDNSINVLLYIGAFLIVVSASIFVGFQWQNFDGVLKANVITLLTVLWFISGFWFYKLPKVRSAGLTFIGIGALLIPFCGLAWYNFVLKAAGYSDGWVWLVTSIISTIVYTVLTLTLRKQFYTYIAQASTFSLFFAGIHVGAFPHEYYILTSLVLGIILMLLRFNLPFSKKDTEIFSGPIETFSQMVVPLSLFYGIFYLSSQGKSLFTVSTTLAVALTLIYYALSYVYTRKIVYFTTSYTLSFVLVYFVGKWWQLSYQMIFYALQLCTFVSFGAAFALSRTKLTQEMRRAISLTVLSPFVWYFGALVNNLSTADLLLFAGCMTIILLMVPLIFGGEYKNLRYLGAAGLYLCLYHALMFFEVSTLYHPAAFMAISIALLLFAHVYPEPDAAGVYQNVSYFGLLAVPVWYGLYSNSYSYLGNARFPIGSFQQQALWMGYISALTYSAEAWMRKNTALKYFASAVAMGVYEWQLHFWGITDVQIYTFPLGIYGLVLAYLRNRAKNLSQRQLCDLFALFFLIVPTSIQAFDTSNSNFQLFALLLGVIGVGLILLGNTFGRRIYIYGGVVAISIAVFSQTYEYLLSLQRWMLTGIGGLLFIVLAVYLLLFRKEGKK